MSKCKCNLRTRLVGDGCQYCNPTLHAELLEEKVADLEAELARLRLTDAERKAVEVAETNHGFMWQNGYGICDSGPDACGEIAATLRGLLERLK